VTRRVAVLGATGLVGRTILRILEERRFPYDTLRLLASDRGPGRTLDAGGRAWPVEPVDLHAFDGVDLALFACKNAISERWAPVAQAAGARVVDNSSAFRYHADVPLVVPEVNADALAFRPTLVANPNCSTIGIVVALAPLARAARLVSLEVATYQSVSGAGSAAVDELERGIRAGLDGTPPRRADGGPAFAYNVVPHIDRFEANGYTREEMKVVWETRKILGLPELPVTVTAVRVPVRIGHAAHVSAVFERPVSPDEARALWSLASGVIVADDPVGGRYPMPLDAAGRDEVLAGRARTSLTHPNGLVFFVASDNLRKGAATNAVQIAEALIALDAPAGGAAASS
jgi:aspartate-semialdehyde dehydrogenase